MLHKLAAGVVIGAVTVAVAVVVFWKMIEHLLVMTLAASIAYRILRHRYFPKTPRTVKDQGK